MERLYLLVVNRPRTLLTLLFLLTCVFGVYAKDIRLDSSVESLLSQDNPDSRYYAEVRRLFGSDEVGVVGLLADDIYTTEVLRKIRRLTDALESIEGVQEVLSLTNALDPIADVVEPPPLVAQIPTGRPAWMLSARRWPTGLFISRTWSPRTARPQPSISSSPIWTTRSLWRGVLMSRFKPS